MMMECGDTVMAEVRCLHELFEAQADVRPIDLALICGTHRLSYRELEHRSNQLAHYLRSYGVGPGKLVGIYFERSAKPIMAILAVLKAGAGYVPIDPNYPIERVRHILTDAEVAVLLTEQALSAQASSVFERVTVLTDSHCKEIAKQPTARLSREECGVLSKDLCHVIYTSGTTGRPKGVMTEHRNVVNFVHAFSEVCRIRNTDRVYQGFSLGFDGSVEEIWMAFSNGATLVVGTQEIVRFGNETARLLTEKGVTFFSTVPTFLSMIEEELPTVRLLIVSGEQCPPELVTRWARPGRRLLNVYGPTETTVNATAAECAPDQPITIGRPLRGYETLVLDADMRPAPPGKPGELYIGGVGVARGYLGQPELTAEKFVTNPFNETVTSPRLYRTGDRVRMTDDGDLEFLGRIDSQVKIRGYRIELSEIETVLIEHPKVRAAAVKVCKREGMQELAAYVVPNNGGGAFERNDVLNLLRTRLPDYMVPGYLDLTDELPTLPSGKVDRRRLPAPTTPLTRMGRDNVGARTELERRIVSLWERLFEVSPISIEDDFFLDLGGHSLLAAQIVSLLRSELKLEVAIRDIYSYPTIRQLAEHKVSSDKGTSPELTRKQHLSRKRSSRAVFERLSRLTRRCCNGLQAVSLYLIYGVRMAPIVGAFLLFLAVREGSLSLVSVIWLGLILGVGLYPAMLGLSIIAKWLIIGRYKPGRYPLWGFYYFRWWLVTRLQSISGAELLAGTPLMSLYYRLMGAKVGPNCTLDTWHCYIFDLVTIGEDTSIGTETQLPGYRVEDGMLILGRVDIGSRCFIGIHAALGLDTRMGDEARLDDLSLLTDGEMMKPGESRRGSPSQPADVPVPEGPEAQTAHRRPLLFGLLHLLTIYATEAILVFAGLPSLSLVSFAFLTGGVLWGVASLVVAAPLFVMSFCLLVAAVKALVLGRVKPGVYPLESSFYLRKWLIDSLIRISRRLVLPLYTTIYFPPWLRLLGAKIGARAEIATVSQISPDLMVANDESFFADGSIIGGRRFFHGRVEIAENRIGRRSFVGNSAILPMGASLGDKCLVGVLSAPPVGVGRAPDGSEWLGSPAFQLPHRQQVDGFNETVTYRPSRKLYIQRLIIDALRIFIPGIIEVVGLGSFALLLLYSYEYYGLWAMLALAPFLGLIMAISRALFVVGVKKLLMGRFEPTVKPLWSMFVWLNEVVNGAYESVAAPALAPLLGTPFFAPYLRLLGCKIGRHVFLETTLFSEFDLVEIGDYAALNLGAVIQNHLFEDRIMKASYLKIGSECSVGNMAVILYDTKMRQGASIGPLSLLMKGETLPSFSRWHGIPTSSKTIASA